MKVLKRFSIIFAPDPGNDTIHASNGNATNDSDWRVAA